MTIIVGSLLESHGENAGNSADWIGDKNEFFRAQKLMSLSSELSVLDNFFLDIVGCKTAQQS